MDAALWVSKTGLDAQQMRMDVISNNLANVNTTGFKTDRAVFEDLLYQNVRQAGGQTSQNTQSPTGLMLGTGVKVIATEKIHSQGNMINTTNALDLSITGSGFFQITQPDRVHKRWQLQALRYWSSGDRFRSIAAAQHHHSQ
jgi:flagellar basal-body rod protein FlgG